MIGQTISHYKILEKLGEGGMGVVYKAQDTKLKRTVALKFLPRESLSDTEAKARFLHEAQAASALNHANITTIYEIYEVQGECFICMEYIEGKSIKELIKGQKLSIEEIIRITIQVAEGLSKAHQKEIVHRDIKSDNILITHDGLVKIMDFGLAKLKGVTKLTKTGSTIGTLQYMSPEQAQGVEVDQRSDIFSFGVVLYEMITGQLPFKGEHEAAIIYSLINETPEPLSRYKANVPEELQRIVNKALQKDRSTRYQSAVDIVADLKGLQKEKEGTSAVKSKKKFIRILVPTLIVLLLAIILLIFKPFGLEVMDKHAIAKENTLAVMYFENMVDKEDSTRLGEIVTNLLITDLSESEYMRVVSSQRLYDILKLLGREGEKKIDRDFATQVATKAKASWMLFGNILQVEPQIIMTSQLVDVGSGKVTASEHITGEPGEKIFSLVDKLTVELKKDLSLPSAAQNEPDRPVADITSHSSEAYRCYLEGIDYDSKYYFSEAEESFKKALKFDSTFAIAYIQLIGHVGRGIESDNLLAKAVKYSDRMSQKGKKYLKVYEAVASGDMNKYIKELQKIVDWDPQDKRSLAALGDAYYAFAWEFDQALYYLSKSIEIDSLYKLPYNHLAYLYNEMGNFEKSIWAINKYISIAPNEANPYDTRGDLYAYNGKLDLAIESYEKANAIKPDFSEGKPGHMYLFKKEYPRADSCYQGLASSSDKRKRSEGRYCLSLIPLYQGKFEEALTVLDNGIAADQIEKVDRLQIIYKHVLRKSIYEQKKDWDRALKESEIVMKIYREYDSSDIDNGRSGYAMLLAKMNDFKKAEDVAEAYKKDIEGKDSTQIIDYWWVKGHIEMSKGNFEIAISNFEKVVKRLNNFTTSNKLAKVYLGAGRLGEAITEYEKALSRYDETRTFDVIWSVNAYYFAGLAYEKSGSIKKAIEKYEEFLNIWKNADPGIKEIEDAKERLKKLKGKI